MSTQSRANWTPAQYEDHFEEMQRQMATMSLIGVRCNNKVVESNGEVRQCKENVCTKSSSAHIARWATDYRMCKVHTQSLITYYMDKPKPDARSEEIQKRLFVRTVRLPVTEKKVSELTADELRQIIRASQEYDHQQQTPKARTSSASGHGHSQGVKPMQLVPSTRQQPTTSPTRSLFGQIGNMARVIVGAPVGPAQALVEEVESDAPDSDDETDSDEDEHKYDPALLAPDVPGNKCRSYVRGGKKVCKGSRQGSTPFCNKHQNFQCALDGRVI
jgi:hypothetical protein